MPKAALPEGHKMGREREELASNLQAWLWGEGDGCNLQVGQGRTAALSQFREVEEEKVGCASELMYR